MQKIIFLTFFTILFTNICAQQLTISSSGQTGSSGTNWTITGTTLTVTGTANIRASVIETALSSGSLTIVGNSSSFTVTQSEAITSTQSGSNLTIGSTSNTGGAINLGANISISGNLYVYGRNVIANANLTSTAGNILLDGDRGSQQSFSGNGVTINSNRILTANNGSISINGRGGNSGASQRGIFLSAGSQLNTTSGAISLTGIGGASSGNQNHGVQLGTLSSTAIQIITTGGAVNITGTGSGTGTSNDNDGVATNAVNCTSGSGAITIDGGIVHNSLYSESIIYERGCIWGHASSQSGPITFIGDVYHIDNNSPAIQILTSGAVVFESKGPAFTSNVTYRNFTISSNISSFRIGKTTNTANIDFTAAVSAAGPIDILGGNVTINANITSSANGDIFIKGIGNSNPCISINSGRTISKSAGSGTLTLQGHARVTNSGTISATGSGLLNVVMWSDFDNSNNDGGVSNFGTISTNGGHAWLGGSNSNGGSYTWNGLTVGDGPSIGSSGYNANALDFTGSISTSNGHVFVWAGNGTGTNGIVTSSTGTINSGTGNITLMSDVTAGTFPLTTTGTISLVPNAESYASDLTLGGLLSSGNFSFNTSHYNGLRINNISSVGGLTIGRTEELLSSGTPVVFGNTSNVTISSALSIAGPINLNGGTITANANLTSTATTGTGISLNGQKIIQNVGIVVTTSGANIEYLASGFSTTSGVDNAIKIGDVSGVRASINAGGGNVSLTGSFGTTSTAGSTDYGIWLFSTDVITSGTGSITMTGDATNTLSTVTAYGISMGNATVKTASGAITLNGTGGKASNNSRGIVADQYSNKIISASGAITLNEIKPTGLTGTYTGFYMRPTTTVNTFIGADGSEVPTSSSSITIKGDRASFDVNGTFRNDINTSGDIVFESNANTFEAAPPLSGLTISGNPSSVRIGKTTNTANITLVNAITTAGPIEVYGGNIFTQQNLTSTQSGAAILQQATGYIDLTADRSIQTSNGNITLRANSGGTAVVLPNSTTGAITLNSGSSLLSTGGNITLGGNFDGTKGTGLYAASARVGGAPGILMINATLSAAGGNINIYGRSTTSFDDGIRLQANISTTGAGSIGIYGDAFGGLTSGTPNIWFGGITFITNSSTIETENGNINVEGLLTNTQSNGTYALNFFRSAYTSGAQDRHIQIISKTGDIQITADRGTTGAGGMGHSSWGHIYLGSPLSGSWTASGDVKFSYSSFVGAGFFGYKVKTTGAVTYEPTAASFVNAQTFPHNANYTVAESASSLTIGKPGNTADITCNATQTVSGPIAIYGGTISINENLNTTAGTTSGNILLKGSGDVILAASKSITTSGAPVILWANSDNQAANGSIALRNGSSIVTGSSSVAGGHVWLGGGSDGTSWNGLAVGSGYAVPGTSFTPSNGGGSLQSGIYLERNSISSFGGNIKIAGDGAATARGIVSYGNTININAGSGKIELDGQVTSSATGNRGGILFGLHDNTIISTVNISSSATSGDAITINGVGRGAEDAIALSGTLNITSSGGGNIVMNGNALGTGRSIVAGNYYHGIMNIFANSGNISLNGNTKAVQVATQIINGLTSGPSKINIGQGGTISSSSSDVYISADNIALAANGIGIISTGKVTIEPSSNSFANAITFPITNLSISNTITGLTLGKSTNTANITFGATTNIAGPITAFGGTIAINENMTSSNGSTISIFGNALTFGTNKTVTSNNGQLIIAPQSDSNTIGLGGATGTLSLPASYFSTNFSDGFANIQIGSNSQTGNIAANTFTLRDNMTFLTSGSLTLGGKPVLGNNNITLGASISSITANASNYFQTNGNGKVISTLASNASRLFPVGNAFYNGVTITNKTNDNDTFSVLIKDSVLGNGDTGRQITTPHVKATWDISKNNANGGNGVDFDFNWNASQEEGGISTFVLNHHNDTVWQIASGTAGSVSGTTTKTMSHTGYMGRFSPFAFGPGVTPLPVELIKFKASCQSDYIQIDWTTASEIRNKAFELYKSENAQDWKFIHTEAGQGDKATATNYTFKDLDKKTGYYRLKDIDEDGIENWSQIIFADCKNDVSDIQVYPNPATDYIKVIAPISENTTLNIINLEGKIIKTMPLISNQNVISVKELTNGIYIINITNNNRSKNIKLLKK